MSRGPDARFCNGLPQSSTTDIRKEQLSTFLMFKKTVMGHWQKDEKPAVKLRKTDGTSSYGKSLIIRNEVHKIISSVDQIVPYLLT